MKIRNGFSDITRDDAYANIAIQHVLGRQYRVLAILTPEHHPPAYDTRSLFDLIETLITRDGACKLGVASIIDSFPTFSLRASAKCQE